MSPHYPHPLTNMELQEAFSPTISILLLIITALFLVTSFKTSKRSKSNNLPPGPWKLPIIGNLHHLATGSLPQHTLGKLSKRYGPLMHLQLGEISAIIVSSPELAKTFLKTHEHFFLGRPSALPSDVLTYNQTEIAFSQFTDHYLQMRKIFAFQLLNNTRVRSFNSIRNAEVSNLVAFIRDSTGSLIDLSSQIYSLTSTNVCKAAFGEKFKDHNSMLSLVNEALLMMGGFELADAFPSRPYIAVVSGLKKKVQRIHKKIDTMLDDIIMKRREYNKLVREHGDRPGEKEDILDVLLTLHQENEQEIPITNSDIKAAIIDIFMAGTETSAALIEWAMSEMIKNPRVMVKAQSELRKRMNEIKNIEERDKHKSNFLSYVVKETLRLHPPIPMVPRESTKSCEINGYNIPAKSKILVNVWAIGRDPKFWEDAEKFIPERFEDQRFGYNDNNFEYIPFGAGRRICPGISFSLATVELALNQLIYHFNWKLPSHIKPEELDMTETNGIAAKKKTPLYLIPELNEATLAES